MRIAFAINGTRGDVQPAMALAAALVDAGHEVSIGVPPNVLDFASRFALDVRALGPDSRDQMATATALRKAAGRNPVRLLRAANKIRDLGWSRMVDDMAELVAGAEVIVAGFTTEQIALVHADAAGIPLVSLHHAPIRRNGRVAPIPAALTSTAGFGPAALIKGQWAAVNAGFWLLTRGRENSLRRQLGLPTADGTLARRMTKAPGVELQAYDPIFAVDDDLWRRDSTERPRPVIGYLAPTPEQGDAVVDPELQAWLTAGDPPVYVGFGSMPVRDPQATLTAVIAMARRVRRRILLCAGWNDLSKIGDVGSGAGDQVDVQVVSEVDHRVVFPQCAAVVHHGGAGTTAAALAAGVPQVICWFGSDQPFWGAELTRLGIGAALPMRQLDGQRLGHAVNEVLTYPVRARRVATTLVSPGRALSAAVDEIERIAGPHHEAGATPARTAPVGGGQTS